VITVALILVPRLAYGQQPSYRFLAPAFAYGRILLAATDKYVVVAMDAANAPAEASGRLPVVVPAGGHSLAILTGAVEWCDLMDENAPPVEAQTWVRGAGGAPSLMVDAPPTLEQAKNAQIEILIHEIAEKLHEYAVDYHARADVPKGAPLLSVLWVSFGSEGPFIWTARYPFIQEWRAQDFYQTRLERPRSRDLLQSPQGLAFAEDGYPEPTDLLGWLARLDAQDPSLEKLWSQPSMALVLEARKTGKAKKLAAQQAADFCRALLEASAPPASEKHTSGVLILDEEGARWIYKPQASP
jgi:hypothetical protein